MNVWILEVRMNQIQNANLCFAFEEFWTAGISWERFDAGQAFAESPEPLQEPLPSA
jgi:hypothetical protein